MRIEPASQAIFSGVAADAFAQEKNVRAGLDAKNKYALSVLEQGMADLAGVTRKSMGERLDFFRFGSSHIEDDLSRDGAYHMTQSYAIALSVPQTHPSYYDQVFILRHSAGALNHSSHDFQRGQPGRSYQTLYFFDALNRGPLLRRLSAGALFFDTLAPNSSMAWREHDKAPYISFDGTLDDPSVAVAAWVRGFSTYLAEYGALKPLVSGIARGKLDSEVFEAVVEADGLMNGTNRHGAGGLIPLKTGPKPRFWDLVKG